MGSAPDRRITHLATALLLWAAPVTSQPLTRSLDSDPRWSQAVSSYRDADLAGAEQLAAALLGGTGRDTLSDRDAARVYTLRAIIAKDADEETRGLSLLLSAVERSLAPWADSMAVASSRRQWLRGQRLILDLPEVVQVVAGAEYDSLVIAGESGAALDPSILRWMLLSGASGLGAPLPMTPGSRVGSKGFSLGLHAEVLDGEYRALVRRPLPNGRLSAALVFALRIERERGEMTASGPPPSAPALRPELRTVSRRSGGRKAAGWLLGGAAVALGARGASRCDRQWDASKEVYLGYAASCGGWVGTTASGLLFLVGSNTFLNRGRSVGVPDEAAISENRATQASYQLALTEYQATRARLEGVRRVKVHLLGDVLRP